MIGDEMEIKFTCFVVTPQQEDPEFCKAGDVVLVAGQEDGKEAWEGIKLPNPTGSFIFKVGGRGGKEVLRIDSDGVFSVMGEIVETAPEVYEAFKEWLKHANQSYLDGGLVVGGSKA